MDGQVVEGGTFGPYHTFGEGVIVINGTFYAPVDFGKGATLINPTFLKCCPKNYSNRWSKVGEGAVVEGGYWEYVEFGANSTLKSGQSVAMSMGGGSTIDAQGRKSGSEGGQYEVNEYGQIVTIAGQEQLECSGSQWQQEMCDKGYWLINDDGTATVTVPKVVICKGGVI